MINVVILKRRPNGNTSARQNSTFEGVPHVGDMVDDWIVERVFWARFMNGRGAYTPHIVLAPAPVAQVVINNGHK